MKKLLATLLAFCVLMLCGCRPAAETDEEYVPAPQATVIPKPPPPPVPPPAQALKTHREVQRYHVDIDDIRFDIAEDLNKDIKRREKEAESTKPQPWP